MTRDLKVTAHGEKEAREYARKHIIEEWEDLWLKEQCLKSVENVHALLSREGIDGRNLWYALKAEEAGDASGFVEDIQRARRLLNPNVPSSLLSPATSMAREVLYALIIASIKTQSARTPRALLKALVDKGVWDAGQSSGRAQLKPDPDDRAESLSLLLLDHESGTHEDEAKMERVIAAARSVADPQNRAKALARLIPRLSVPKNEAVAAEVLDLSAAISDPDRRAEHLTDIVGFLPPRSLMATLAWANGIQDEGRRDRLVWAAAARFAHLGDFQKAVDLTLSLRGDLKRGKALGQLAEAFCRWGYPDDGVRVAGAIADEDIRARAFADMARHLPSQRLKSAWEPLQQVPNEPFRADLMVRFLEHAVDLPEDARETALAAVKQFNHEPARARVLLALIPHLPDSDQKDAWIAAWMAAHGAGQTGDEFYRRRLFVSAYRTMAIGLKQLRRRPGQSNGTGQKQAAGSVRPQWRRDWKRVRRLRDHESRAQLLAKILPDLPEGLLAKVRRMADRLEEGSGSLPRPRAQVYMALALRLAELNRPNEALTLALAIEAASTRDDLLSALAAQSVALGRGQEALTAISAMSHHSSRKEVLASLADQLPGEVLLQGVRLIGRIDDSDDQAAALAALAALVPSELGDQALDTAVRAVETGSEPVRLLPPALGLLRPDALGAALQRIGAIHHEGQRSETLAVLSFFLPPGLLRDIEYSIYEIRNPILRGSARGAIAHRWAQAGNTRRALSLVMRMPDVADSRGRSETIDDERFAALIGSSQWRWPISRPDALAHIAPFLDARSLVKAWAAATAIKDHRDREQTLTGLVPWIPASLLPRAMQAQARLRNAGAGEDLSAALVPRLAERDGYDAALQAALAISSDRHRSKALVRLALHLAGTGQGSRALEAVSRLPESYGMGTELAEIASALAKLDLHDPALAVIEKIEYSGDLGKALERVAAYLPVPRLVNSLERAAPTMQAKDWLKTAIGIIDRLPKARKKMVYQDLAHLLEEKMHSTAGNSGWIPALSEESYPVLKDLAPKALPAIQAIADHGERAQALAALAPILPPAGRQEAYRQAMEICRKSASRYSMRSFVAILASQLQILDRESLLAVWQASLAAMVEWGRAEVLHGLDASAGIIAHFGGKEAVLQAAAAIRKVARWWP